MLHKRFVDEKRSGEKRARLQGMLALALAWVVAACMVLNCPFAVAETADASAVQPDPVAYASGSTGHAPVSTVDQTMVRVEGFGVSFELPASTGAATMPALASSAACEVACWRVPCGSALLDDAAAGTSGATPASQSGSSTFTLVAVSRSLADAEFSLQAYADGLIAQAAASSDAARVAEGGFGTSASGVGYYLTGMVDRTSMTVVIALAVDGAAGGTTNDPAGNPADGLADEPVDADGPLVTVFALRGPAGDDAVVRGIYALLESFEPATGENPAATSVFDQPAGLAYYSVSRLAALPSGTVVDLLERGVDAGTDAAGASAARHAAGSAALTYVDGPALSPMGSVLPWGWAGQDGGPFGDEADVCLVTLVEYDDLDGDGEPFATRDAALAGERLSGVEVEWHGLAIPWDEASDAADLLMAACGLSGTLADGYVGSWGDEGAYFWARVGACQINGEPGYWQILVDALGGDDVCTVTVAADLLHGNALAPGFASYDELVGMLWG